MTILETINQPADLKTLTSNQLEALADEVRALVLDKVSKVGGHVGPNLGTVELTIALHKVFNSPIDKIVWDVSHQSYPHKILTGRKNGFVDGHFHDITGYTSQHESEHDFFTVGHTSTSIANAMGLAHARDLTGATGNVIAVIGDGSLSGGLAFEALNNAGEFDGNLIVIVNDNEMSIAENHGGLYPHLAKLRESNGTAANNIFTSLGLDYHYIAAGNSIDALITGLESVKDTTKPVVLHIHTEKGHGYAPAVANKEKFHWSAPFELATGLTNPGTPGESYTEMILDYMGEKVDSGMPLVAINAAIPGLMNLKSFAAKYPKNYKDVGIAEQYSITYGQALAAGGARPFIFHNSTFLQRAYDQLSHDLAINEYPAIVIVKGGVINGSDKTHQGSMAIGMISNIPNLVYLAPTSAEELLAMLDWATAQTAQPVVIQLPEHGVEHRSSRLTDFSKPVYDVIENGADVAILGLGGFYNLAEKAAAELEKSGIKASLVNPLFISQLDETALLELAKTHKVIVTLEDGVLDGGFGQKVAGFLGQSDVKVLNFGAKKEFNDSVPVAELYQRYHLTPELIASDVLESL
ncbi:1-deoxy-D-xylulose-5-phosphate synthase [Pseudolactococcus insecticola]|uniref:1-deoxy-D-xylulose-5-phosphate synthase n=1 Tax=Pseudolactococcus insecticola TaxID=2709158 RepID=A0A6A0B549_9LACT|nr:1-deoxy-D-xylulose-5-phosphate synthase [Lactococcus insecticola]GFH39773.1 1-deoxy-D-xylulose-5-phosphate synthase [Lactococcus insecticola]